MKKNDWILAISVAVYSFLFYDQAPGMNFLLFNIVLITLLTLRDRSVITKTSWLLAAVGSVISSACIAYYGPGVNIFANIVSLSLLSAYSFHPKTSVITSGCFAFYSFISAFIFMIIDGVERIDKRNKTGDSASSGFARFMLYGIPVLVFIIFFLMYKSSNALFDQFTKMINLDFISWGWIIFTLSGLMLMYGFFYHKRIKMIAQADENSSSDLDPLKERKAFAGLTPEQEIRSGLTLFIMLNILLLFVNILDTGYLISGNLPEGLSYSEFVHKGTGTLILSIIFAILIILFYFRGELNFKKGNSRLKFLAYFWILQNIFMIICTAQRNSLYIHEYSLTYKRIGVYLWLVLAVIGLLTTFVKILKLKSNWFLFRSNAWLFYGVLVISCFFSWDLIIAEYNIHRAVSEHKALDKYYLASLSNVVLPSLIEINASGSKPVTLEDTLTDSEFKSRLDADLYYFLSDSIKHDWRSFTFIDRKITREISALNDEGKIRSLNLPGRTYISFRNFEPISRLKELSISKTYFWNLNELEQFKELESLDLSSNGISTLEKLPRMDNLKRLNLSYNRLTKIDQITNAPNLEVLDISGNGGLINYIPLTKLKKLKQVIIGSISCENLEILQMALPRTEIIASLIN